MWRLPGYGDFLEQSDPELRERMADSGARRRASRTWSRRSIRSPDDQPEVPAHWSVTFAVDDADATASGPRSSAAKSSSRPSMRPGSG